MLAEARADLLALLEGAGIRAFAEVPERPTPPLAVFVPSPEWIVTGEAFGEFVISFDIEIIASAGSNRVISRQIDDAVELALSTINGADGFYCSSVGAPSGIEINGAVYLGATITVKQNFRI